MGDAVSLVVIERDGSPRGYVGALPEIAVSVVPPTLSLYTSTGFVEPWVCYFAVRNGVVVGTCGFKSLPVDGRVEIAYFTFPGFEGRGLASAMAARLVAIARPHFRSVQVVAQTLPDRNASHRVLEKLGFVPVGERDHPEDGRILDWQLAPESS